MYTKWFTVGLYIFFSLLCSAVVKSICPPQEDIYPCRCETPFDPAIVCANITKMETIREVFEHSHGIIFKNFVIENSALQFLPASSLISKRIRGLAIINTTLTGLFDEVPSSANTVEVFLLQNVIIQRAIQWNMLQKLTKLFHIQFINLTIKKLGKEFIGNINQGIKVIFLSQNKLSSLADGVFENLNALGWLTIINNEVKILKRSMFPRPARLKHLDLLNNRIEFLPDDLFTDMPDLKAIGLKGNRISFLEDPVFGAVFNQLVLLNVAGNPIKCDCSIHWMTNRDHSYVLGACEEPSSRKGKQLKDLTEEEFRHCN
ncbi:uncharacterized protein NPIL_224111 [Nephila pilipes]|uniref:Uncharacterized protein n=1 Tax=Nephila pilipes TaxID=299642 RepID=A0A8X6MJT3_NEPPI|nr:uncharacterized protein NPIL_224111 [Nephila pilipes]